MNKPKLFLTSLGLFLGLMGTMLGIYFSSAIENTPFMFGIVSAIFIAISVGIVAGVVNKSKELTNS